VSTATATATGARRPAIVTVAVVCAYVGGLASTVLGILVLLSRYRVPETDVLAVSLIGAGIILFGLLTLGVASGLARGSRMARLFASLYLVLALALHVWTIVGTDWDPVSIALILVDGFVLAALWLRPGARYFRR
jgi:holin-like protein